MTVCWSHRNSQTCKHKGPKPAPFAPTALSTDGRTIYAIGDIHGRVDLLDALLAKIDADVSAASERPDRPSPERVPTLVLLGDYIDRGPDSRRVIDRILALGQSERFETIALRGNHEASLLEFLDDSSLGPAWTSHGGMATLASYNVPIPHLRTDPQAWLETRDALLDAVPESHLGLLQDAWTNGGDRRLCVRACGR